MKINLNEEIVMATGIITSNGVKFANVGINNTPNAKFSIALGDKEYINCVCWNKLAEYVAKCSVGANLFVIGKIKSREYNGKTYEDLYCDFVLTTENTTSEIPTEQADDFIDIDESDPLPF